MNQEMINKTYAVALSGGGARGAYEMGVWKALKEMDINIAAVAGTSIGSINGALMAQGDFDIALEVWNSLTPEIVFDTELTGIERYRDTTKMQQLLKQYINEDKIRESKIDYALVTFNLSAMKDETLFADEIPQGKLLDYILASANYPLFKRHKIDGNYYIDGGIYNNLPAKPLSDRGHQNIIIVDVRDMFAMTYKKFDTSGHFIVNIRSRHDLYNVMNFSRELIQENLNKGYFDTLMAFEKYIGSYYYVLEDGTENTISTEDLNLLNDTVFFKKLFDSETAMLSVLECVNDFMNAKEIQSIFCKEFFVACLEICAEVIGVEKIAEYTIRGLCNKLLIEINDIIEKGKNIESSIKERVEEKISERSLLFDNEDKKIVFAALLRNVDRIVEKISFLFDTIAIFAPKVIIAYLTASILQNRAVKEETD